jgi:hypothetical protein
VWVSLLKEAITEPSAHRGPQPGSQAGVVDAPDAGVNFSPKRLPGRDFRRIFLLIHGIDEVDAASSATALGSVMASLTPN